MSHASGPVDVRHLEVKHDFLFGPGDDPEFSPYALEILHRELHRREGAVHRFPAEAHVPDGSCHPNRGLGHLLVAR